MTASARRGKHLNRYIELDRGTGVCRADSGLSLLLTRELLWSRAPKYEGRMTKLKNMHEILDRLGTWGGRYSIVKSEAAVDGLAILESISSDETCSGRSAHDEEGSKNFCKKRVERGVATGRDKR